MDRPNECKHCGLHATWHIDEDTFFACGTIYAGRGDYWNQSTGCVEILQSRKRIKRAVEVLERARRFDFIDLDLIESWDAQKAVEILTGKQIHDAS